MEETALCPQNICPDDRFEAWSLCGQVLGFGWEGLEQLLSDAIGLIVDTSSPFLANLAAGRVRLALKCSCCSLQIFCARKNYFRVDEPDDWAVSLHCCTFCGIKWNKMEQLMDKKEKLIMDVCY